MVRKVSTNTLTVFMENVMDITYLIDEIDKVSVPDTLSTNQSRITLLVNYTQRKLIITKEKNSERKFGGSFVKIGKNDDSNNTNTWVSSSLNEDELKEVISIYFGVPQDSLYRFY